MTSHGAVNTAAAFAAISKTGDLAYIPDTPDSPINMSVDLGGRLMPLPDTGLEAVRVSPDGSVFGRVLDRYFRGERDPATLCLLGPA